MGRRRIDGLGACEVHFDRQGVCLLAHLREPVGQCWGWYGFELHSHTLALHIELNLRRGGETLQMTQSFAVRDRVGSLQGFGLCLPSQHVRFLQTYVLTALVAVAQGVERGGDGNEPEQNRSQQHAERGDAPLLSGGQGVPTL